jgi:hypothetical protein
MYSTYHRFNAEENHKAKTCSMTFRLGTEYFDKLQQEAASQGISANSLMNQVLKDYFEWNIFQRKIGFVPLVKPVIKEIFDNMSKEQVIQIANIAKEEGANALYFMKGRMDLDCFLSWFEDRMKNSSTEVSHTFDNSSRIHTYVIKHDVCQKWSIYLKEIIEHIFDEILKRKVEASALNTSLTFRFKEED